ncbi:MAG: ankyrin repeat domain-containing protein, partial [Elusimicrobiota bacterium]
MNWFATAAVFLTLPFLVACATSPLNLAIQRKDFSEVKRLVESGADINKRDSIGADSAPLPQAVWHGTPEIVAYLVQKGARAHDNAMYMAAYVNIPEMFDALFDNGVQVPPAIAVNQRIRKAQERRAARAAPASHGNLDDDAYN